MATHRPSFRARFIPAVLGLALAGLGGAAWPVGASAATPKVNLSGDARIVTNTDGGLTLRLDKADGRASLVFNYNTGGLDLSAFRDVAVPVKNGATAELDVLLTAISDFEVQWKHTVQGRFLVRAGEDQELRVTMTRAALPADHPMVKQLGNLYAFPTGYHRHWQYLHTEDIQRVALRLDWHGARPGQTVEVGRPGGFADCAVDAAALASLELPVIDAFGQATAGEWPGKIAGLDELRADAKRDLALVAASTRPAGQRNRFGGLTDGPAFKATGFFRTEKHDGKWWLVDPEGRLFWSIGVNTVGSSVETRVAGREQIFPESARGETSIRHYWENLKHKHGEDWPARHVDVTVARLFDWGVNTVGAWSTPAMTRTERVPYNLMVHTALQGVGKMRKLPDPYSAAFRDSLDKRLAEEAAIHAKSPWLLGVFIHNELDWGGGHEIPEQVLATPKGTPARAAFMTFLQKRHGDLAGINQAWGTAHATLADIRPGAGPGGQTAYRKDLGDFLVEFADTYFTLCREAMDRHFPNHLYLGCRFHTFNPVITAAASRFCDVISVNVYRHTVTEFTMTTAEDRPWLISEFHFGIRDFGTWGVGLAAAADARNQADLYRAYLSDALGHANFVGAHWFMWSNQPVTGRADGENFGVGLVTIVDRPVEPLINAIREVSTELYEQRLNHRRTRIGAGAPR